MKPSLKHVIVTVINLTLPHSRDQKIQHNNFSDKSTIKILYLIIWRIFLNPAFNFLNWFSPPHCITIFSEINIVINNFLWKRTQSHLLKGIMLAVQLFSYNWVKYKFVPVSSIVQNTNKQNINLEHWSLYTEMDAGLTNKLTINENQIAKNCIYELIRMFYPWDPEHSLVTNYGQNINIYKIDQNGISGNHLPQLQSDALFLFHLL